MDHFKSAITLFFFIYFRLSIFPQTGGTINFNDYVPAECSSEPLLTIGLITDPQYCECDPYGTRYYRETMWKLPQAMDTMNKYQVDFVMSMGDMIDRYYESYDSVSQHYEKLNMPYYNLLGNHEFEEVADELKSSIVSRYGMPDYYYTYNYGNWRFLVLDGTELAEYSRYIHPDLADEGDSVWGSIQGMINGLPWNGGISKAQQSWIRSEIEDAADSGQNVILFCHFPVYPDSVDLNLWNKDEIINLLGQYPNVVAYINGHFHEGNYWYQNNIHYYTQAAMLDTPDTNSFAIMRIYPKEIVIQGFGRVPDRTMSYNNFKKKTLQIALSDTLLHYAHQKNDLIGYLSYTSAESDILANLILDTARYSNRYYSISNDSLLLNTDEDLSLITDLKINVIAVDCDVDTFSQTFSLLFDTTVMKFRYQLPDTVISVYSDYSLNIDSLLEDLSKFGMDISLNAITSGIVTFVSEVDTVKIIPQKTGITEILLSASDPFTGKDYQQGFRLEVIDPLNHAPYHTETALTDYIVQPGDTAIIRLADIFIDPDGDLPDYYFDINDSAIAKGWLQDSILLLAGLKPGIALIAITANDSRGGLDSVSLNIMVNSVPVRVKEYDEFLYQFTSECTTIYLDSLFADSEGDTIAYMVSSVLDSLVLDDANQLNLCPENAGTYKIYLSLTDGKGSFYSDSLEVRFNAGPEAFQQLYQFTYTALQEPITLDLKNIFTDADDDTINFMISHTDTISLVYAILGFVLQLHPKLTDTFDFYIVASDNFGGKDSTMLRLVYQPELSVLIANRLINHLKIFPNPASGVLHIQFESIADGPFGIRLSDQNGRIIYQSVGLNANPGINYYEIKIEDNKFKGLCFLNLNLNNECIIAEGILIE